MQQRVYNGYCCGDVEPWIFLTKHKVKKYITFNSLKFKQKTAGLG